MISKYLFSIFVLIVVNLGTATIAQQFPASIQACIDRGDCTTPVLVSPSSNSSMHQYRYTDKGVERFLYRYSLGDNSGYQGSSDNGFSPSSEEAGFSGVVWLSARESYASNFRAGMTLYTDQVSVDEQTGNVNGNVEFRGDISLSLCSEALLAGEGSLFSSPPETNYDNPSSLFSDGPFSCIAPGCFVGAEFNLVNINYEQVGDRFVTGVISRSANLEGQFLYSQTSGFPGFDDYSPSQAFNAESSLYVGTPVTAPTAPVLLGDVNLSGRVDFSDIPLLVFYLQFGVNVPEADCNEDGVVDFADIPAFIDILANS